MNQFIVLSASNCTEITSLISKHQKNNDIIGMQFSTAIVDPEYSIAKHIYSVLIEYKAKHEIPQIPNKCCRCGGGGRIYYSDNTVSTCRQCKGLGTIQKNITPV